MSFRLFWLFACFDIANCRFVIILHQSISTVFPTALVYFMFLCHILVILKLFHAFSCYYICHGGFWLMNIEVTILIWGEATRTVPVQDGDLDECILTAPPIYCSLFSLPSSSLPISWDTATLKLVQLMPLQWPINVQMKEIHTFLTLNQNLEMIKLRKACRKLRYSES